MAASVAPALAAQTGLLRGLVRDTAGSPIPNAMILAMPSTARTASSPRGSFMMWDLAVGTHVVSVRALGFAPESFVATIDPADTVTVVVTMKPAPLELPELTVVAEGQTYRGRMAGFGERLRSRAGPRSSYYTREDIIKAGPTARIEDLLVRAGLMTLAGRPFCARGQQKDPVAVYLDGALLTGGNKRPFDFNTVPVDWLEAIEVYRSTATRPAEFNATGAGCVVVLWTRDR